MSAKKAQRILIIEDDETQAEMLRHFLVMWGYEIRISLSGEDAVNSLTEFLPDLILLDLYLPGMPGLDALKHIRAVPELVDIPVFIMSADDSEEIKIVSLSSGGNEFLPKPIVMADLAMKIQTALELLESRRIIEELNHKLEKEKRRLLRYFSADLVEKILNEEIPAQLGGDIMVSSIMFFDVRGSTTMAEKMGPGFFASFISDLFADIMDIIFENKGSVNELLGDGILATFGCPVPTDDDAYNAIRAAIDIRTYVRNFNSLVTESVGYGIGIATGRVFAGNIGSIRRMKYAVMGDPVNAAARIQDMTKELNVPILFDHFTFEPCRSRLRANSHGYFKLRGKEEIVEIFGVDETDPFIGHKSQPSKLAAGNSGLFHRFLERDSSFEFGG